MPPPAFTRPAEDRTSADTGGRIVAANDGGANWSSTHGCKLSSAVASPNGTPRKLLPATRQAILAW